MSLYRDDLTAAKKFGLMLPESSFKIGFDTRYIDYEEDGLMEEDGC